MIDFEHFSVEFDYVWEKQGQNPINIFIVLRVETKNWVTLPVAELSLWKLFKMITKIALKLLFENYVVRIKEIHALIILGAPQKINQYF